MLSWGELPDPVAGPGEVLVKVAASAVNRADVAQRQGHYPPPPGAPETLGLECSGTIAALGRGVTGWSVGDEVCALLAGGGYAELAVVPVGQLLPVPAGVSLIEAAALPEVTCTVWSNVVTTARLHSGEVLLVHGGSSGIGTMTVQVGRLLGARVAVTAGSQAKLDACLALGASIAVNYKEEDFVEVVRAETGGHGADVILDPIGAGYLERNLALLAPDGRLVSIGLQKGRHAEIDLGLMMAKRLTLSSTSLRSRPHNQKAAIVASVREGLWPAIEDGVVRPVVDQVLAMSQAAQAHRLLEASGHIGKLVLAV
ncbi:NAD(P)H-quinone oxidoreductase [Acidothermaceae bacterium B102]|nr:NAD(P)H-quinone oxidoreductase [Acidothermaceae bacterium B102]